MAETVNYNAFINEIETLKIEVKVEAGIPFLSLDHYSQDNEYEETLRSMIDGATSDFDGFTREHQHSATQTLNKKYLKFDKIDALAVSITNRYLAGQIRYDHLKLELLHLFNNVPKHNYGNLHPDFFFHLQEGVLAKHEVLGEFIKLVTSSNTSNAIADDVRRNDNASNQLSFPEAAMIFYYLKEANEENAPLLTDGNASKMAYKMCGKNSNGSGKGLLIAYGEQENKTNRVNLNEFKRTDNQHRERFKKIIKYLAENGYTKAEKLAKDEEAVFLNNYERHYSQKLL